MKNLADILNKFHPLKQKTIVALSGHVVKVSFSKNSNILSHGEICDKLYFVESGFVRAFQYKNEREVTKWFAAEHTFFTSMPSFIKGIPSTEIIEAYLDTKVYYITKDDLDYLLDKYTDLNSAIRKIMEHLYLELHEYVDAIVHEKAIDRYHYIIDKRPELLQKTTLGHIASYLAISQETLSRIRSNGVNKKQ